MNPRNKNYESIWSRKCGLPWPAPLAVRTSTPVSVTIIVCSNCADHLPSVVTAVQSSGHRASFQTPVTSNNEFQDIIKLVTLLVKKLGKSMVGSKITRAWIGFFFKFHVILAGYDNIHEIRVIYIIVQIEFFIILINKSNITFSLYKIISLAKIFWDLKKKYSRRKSVTVWHFKCFHDLIKIHDCTFHITYDFFKTYFEF